MRRVIILAYCDAQILDLTGPASVFAEAAEFTEEPPYQVVVGSLRRGLVRTSSGIDVHAKSLSRLLRASFDTLIIPGGSPQGVRTLLRDHHFRAKLSIAVSRASRVCSVCTGAFILADIGVLDGRRATTHWQAAKEFARRYPSVKVEEEALFVEEDKFWTSAGVSTGIDMALAVVERDLGRQVAVNVARRLVVQACRPGHQSQFSALLEAQAGPFAPLMEWISQNLALEHPIESLAKRVGQSPRTFYRRFTAACGQTPAAFVKRLRLDRARSLLEAGEAPKRVAVLSGFNTLDNLGRTFRDEFGLAPSIYRALHGGR